MVTLTLEVNLCKILNCINVLIKVFLCLISSTNLKTLKKSFIKEKRKVTNFYSPYSTNDF